MRVMREVRRINHARAQSGVVFVFAMVWGLSWFLCCVSGSMVRFFCIDLRERFVHAREERFSC